MCACVYVCVYAWVNLCKREFACVRGFVSVCIHVCVSTCVRVCVFASVCMRTCD